MKKFLMLATILLSACSCCENEEVIIAPQVQETKPVQTINYNRAYNAYYTNQTECNTCSTSYTVSKPVEVIYKDITYTTVYEPKTYEEVSYSRRPYNSCVNSDLCE